VRIEFGQGVDQLGQDDVVGVAAGPSRGLDDDRRVDGFSRLHDRQALFHVVDIIGRQAVVVLGRVVEKLSQRDARHGDLLRVSIFARCSPESPSSHAVLQRVRRNIRLAISP
jgi:hypothetical protein